MTASILTVMTSMLTVSTGSRTAPTSPLTPHVSLVMCPQVLPSASSLAEVIFHSLSSSLTLAVLVKMKQLKQGRRKEAVFVFIVVRCCHLPFLFQS